MNDDLKFKLWKTGLWSVDTVENFHNLRDFWQFLQAV